MTQHTTEFKTLLITNPIYPESIIDDLKQVFEKVIYTPAAASFEKAKPDDVHPTEDQFAEADAILAFTVPVGLKHISQTPRLKLFQGMSAGINALEEHEFFTSLPEDHPLIAASASGIHVSAISEHTVSTTIALFHQLHRIIIAGHNQRKWVNARQEFGGGSNFIRELRGQTVGIIGYGHIGRETARLFASFGSKIIALTRSGKPAKLGGYIVNGTGDAEGKLPEEWFSTESDESKKAFYQRADVFVNTLPLNKATKGFVDREAFTNAKEDSVYVNIGRGDTTDQNALVEALQAKEGPLKIGGASLDVTTPEPLPEGHALWTLPNTIISPHCSGVSVHYFVLAADLLKVNVERLRAGKGGFNAWKGKGEE